MGDYLFFRLYGPLAAWGIPAVGELRPIQDYPSRSAILGFLGATLGVRRDDADGQKSLSDGYGVAIRIDAKGTLLEDYHTIETPKERRGFVPATRRDEIVRSPGETDTMITRRGYRQDALSVVALWQRAGARWSLDDLAVAIRKPFYMPYLGRKGCPLALPACPTVIRECRIVDGLAEVERRWAEQDRVLSGVLRRLPSHHDQAVDLVWDEDMPDASEWIKQSMKRLRRDCPTNRQRWQFGERYEYHTHLPGKKTS